MKIATITCHDVYNHGASLQAYALMRYLSDLGHDVRIIDYKPDYLSNHFRFDVVANPVFDKPFIKQIYLIAKLPERLRALPRKKAFDRFKDRYLRLTEKRYRSNEELKEDCPDADLFIAGSDQIWNTTFRNGKDPAFYLDFVPDAKIKISYAASFATDALAEGTENFVKHHLEKFDDITIRESSGCRLAKSLGYKATQVVDPVFLLSREKWEELSGNPYRAEKPYLLVYDFQMSDAIREMAMAVAKQKNLEILSISPFRLSYVKKNFVNAGPIEFLKLLRGAECIVSNSFHGTAFSLIFEKDFFVVNREDGLNTRMRDFLQKYELSERMVTPGDVHMTYPEIDFTKALEKLKEDISCAKKIIDSWTNKSVRNF